MRRNMRRAGLVIAVAAFAQAPFSASAQNSMGLRFLPTEQYNRIPFAQPPAKGELPDFIDLSIYGYLPKPGNQGSQGSCVAWAVGYGLKSYQQNREYRRQNIAADFRFSPSFIYNQIKAGDCAKGSWIKDALNILQEQGAVPMEMFEYNADKCSKLPTEVHVQSALEHRIAAWRRVNTLSLVELKAQLAKGFPVVIGMDVYESFQLWKGGAIYEPKKAQRGGYRGGHAMLLVGYSDGARAFKVMNSWGEDWGDKGFVWIGYSTFQEMVREGYTAVDIFHDHSAARMTTAAAASTGFVPPPRPPSRTRAEAPPERVARSGPTAAPLSSAPAGPESRASEPPTTGAPVKLSEPKRLTPEILTQAVRSSTKPKLSYQWKHYTVMPYSVWLDLPDNLAKKISRAEYWFYHKSYKNPKKSRRGSSLFIAKWDGYGCINNAKVTVFLKSGKKMEAPFDLCEAQEKI